MTSLHIPTEGSYSDIEHDWIENEPPGLFPADQTSVYGQMRKVQADYLQVVADLLSTWYGNLDPRTVTLGDMSEWEYQVGAPVAPTGRALEARRAFVISRRERGPFTRRRRYTVVESFLQATLGSTVLYFTTGGLPFTPGGMFFGTGLSSLVGVYRIYENVPAFSYEVWIRNNVTPDIGGLTRELLRITPAGITFTIDNTKTDVLNYFRTVRNNQPIFWWRAMTSNLTNIAPAGGSVVLNGGVSSWPTPGLLSAAVTTSDAATLFNGSTGYVTMANYTQLNPGDYLSVALWVRPASIGVEQWVLDKGTGSYAFWIDSTGHVAFGKSGIPIVTSTTTLVAGQTYHIAATKRLDDVRIYINGVDRSGSVIDNPLVNNTNVLTIGRRSSTGTNYFNGIMDEIAVYNKPLSPAAVLEQYNTGRDVP